MPDYVDRSEERALAAQNWVRDWALSLPPLVAGEVARFRAGDKSTAEILCRLLMCQQQKILKNAFEGVERQSQRSAQWSVGRGHGQ